MLASSLLKDALRLGYRMQIHLKTIKVFKPFSAVLIGCGAQSDFGILWLRSAQRCHDEHNCGRENCITSSTQSAGNMDAALALIWIVNFRL